MRRGQERFAPVEGYDVGTLARDRYVGMIVRKAGLFPGDRVLDVQTGTGIIGVNVSRAFTRSKVVVTDALRENLEHARANAIAERCKDRMDFVLALPDELPFKDETFFFTTTGFMLAIEEDPLATLDEIHRVTGFTGKVYMPTLDLRKKTEPIPGVTPYVFTDETVREMRDMGFSKVLKSRVMMVGDGVEILIVMTKRYDPEDGEEVEDETAE